MRPLHRDRLTGVPDKRQSLPDASLPRWGASSREQAGVAWTLALLPTLLMTLAAFLMMGD